MQYTMKKLNHDSIIDSFLPEQFDKIRTDKIWDAIPTIHESSDSEMSMLETWKRHWRSVREPYVITRELGHQGRTVLTLWAERKV